MNKEIVGTNIIERSKVDEEWNERKREKIEIKVEEGKSFEETDYIKSDYTNILLKSKNFVSNNTKSVNEKNLYIS